MTDLGRTVAGGRGDDVTGHSVLNAVANPGESVPYPTIMDSSRTGDEVI